MNAIEEIKNQVDIVDLISEDVKLRRSGKNYTGFCPFHANTRTPAFVVFPDSGTWRCFGECNEGGDIFRYMMKKEGLDFRDALKKLAERAGVRLEPLTPQRKEQTERAEQLGRLLEDAVIFYRSQLLQTEPGRLAMAYLEEKRGIKAQTVETWGVGYAPDSWDALMSYFTAKGYPLQDLIDCGLLSQKEDGSVYDRFRHRLMFPIRDASGRMTGFGGRVMNPEDLPKFINSPQTLLFDKSSILFGLDQARKAIRRENQAVVVEGYLDVIVLHQEGFHNVVSPMGTALTEAQMRQLKRFSRCLVLALDPDAAGVKATLRGLEVARESLDRTTDLVFDARGLLHSEARLQADLRVSTLPDDLDPDEIVLRNPEEWKTIIENAQSIILHVLETLMQGQDIDDPKVKSEIAARILPLISDVPNPVERDAYRQQVARALQVSEEALLQLSSERGRRKRTATTMQRQQIPEPHAAETGTEPMNRIMEKQLLDFLMRFPEQLYKINRTLQIVGLNRLTRYDFSFADCQQVAELIFKSLTQNDLDPNEFIRDNMLDEIDLFTPEPGQTGDEKTEKRKDSPQSRELEEAVRIILQLRRTAVNTQITQLRFLQTSNEDEQSNKDLEVYQTSLLHLIKQRWILDKALSLPIRMD